MSAHTEGPWDRQGTEIVKHHNGDSQPIAQVLIPNYDVNDDLEQIANALLMAAAPRMVNALQRASFLFAEYNPVVSTEEGCKHFDALRAEIVRCIEQATPDYYGYPIPRE